MSNLSVCIAPMCYKRPKVFEVFAQGVHNLIERFPDVDFTVICVASIGEEPTREQVESHGFKYYEYKNYPLTDKAQYRLEKVKEENCDYWISISDDDFMTPAYFAFILDKMYMGYEYLAPYDLFYIRNSNLYYSDPYHSNHYRHGEPLAIGKAVSRSLLERVDYKLWTIQNRDRGLDKDAYNVLREYSQSNYFFSCKDVGAMVVDVKSNTNLSQWSKEYELVTEDIELLFPHNLIKKIKDVPHTR